MREMVLTKTILPKKFKVLCKMKKKKKDLVASGHEKKCVAGSAVAIHNQIDPININQIPHHHTEHLKYKYKYTEGQKL